MSALRLTAVMAEGSPPAGTLQKRRKPTWGLWRLAVAPRSVKTRSFTHTHTRTFHTLSATLFSRTVPIVGAGVLAKLLLQKVSNLSCGRVKTSVNRRINTCLGKRLAAHGVCLGRMKTIAAQSCCVHSGGVTADHWRELPATSNNHSKKTV